MAKEKKDTKWIQKAVKRPGALRAKAKKAGGMTKEGKIKAGWLKKAAKLKKGDPGNGRTGRQARLALTFRKMKKK